MIKLLHISDIHLDRPFKSRNGKVKQYLKEAMRTAFQRAVSFYIEKNLDVLLVAGDLFDGETVEPGTALFLKSELNRLKEHGIQVVYATGNHDCAQRIRSLAFFTWPEHVHLALSPEPQVFNMKNKLGKPFKIVACGHHTSVETVNAVSRFPTKHSLVHTLNGLWVDSETVIGVAHSWLTSQNIEGKERYLPCTIEDLKVLDYDYFALGHIHARHSFLNGKVGYSGSLQAIDSDETGFKGGVYVEIEKGALKTTFVPFSAVVFSKIEVDVEGIKVLDEIGEVLIASMVKGAKEQGTSINQVLFTLQLKGRSQLKSMLEQRESLEALKEMILARTGVVEVVLDPSGLLHVIKVEDYVDTDTFLGHLLRTLQNSSQLDLIVDAMMSELKLATLFDNRTQAREWVLQVLINGQDELIQRMVRHEEDIHS